MPQQIELLTEALRSAGSVLFITGAGISAESGLPTYRGVSGLYNRPTADGIEIEEALSGDMFRRNPAVTWKHILEIEHACRGAGPSAAHLALTQICQKTHRAWVLTQNVDGLHRAALSPNLIEIHGSLRSVRCTSCTYRTESPRYADWTPGEVPRCPKCAGVLRPDVVLFGEALPTDAVKTLERELTHGFEVVVSIGTSSAFPYIQAPIELARQHQDRTFEINPEPTLISRMVDEHIAARAGDVLSEVVRQL